jgi:hypothetical protein
MLERRQRRRAGGKEGEEHDGACERERLVRWRLRRDESLVGSRVGYVGYMG